MPNQVDTLRILNLLRGGARGLTADVMGAPVDLATTVANLGVAGGGYAAHKLGLVDQPPKLIDPKTVPGSSDWFSKGTPLEEQEGEGKGYDVARLATSILPGLLRIGCGVGRMPTKATEAPRGSPEAQRGALYLNKQGIPQGEDLAAYHTTEGIMGLPKEYDMNQRISSPLKELTMPSFAITSNKGDFDPIMNRFGNNILIPNPKAIDPRTSNVSLKAHDFYTPRRDASYETELLEKAKERGVTPDARVLAKLRLMDRFDRDYVKGGTGGEGGSDKGMIGYEPSTMSMNTTPRFQTMEHFDTSLKGGGRIRQSTFNPNTGSHNPSLQFNMYDKLVGQETPYTVLAKGIDPTQRGVELANAMQSTALNSKYWKGVSPLDAEEYAKYGDRANIHPGQVQNLLDRLRKYKKDLVDYGPSEYAEAKKWGPMQINRENFLGYIADTDKEYELAKWNLGKRKMPVFKRSEFEDNREIHDYIADMQTMALRRRGR